MVTKSVFSKRQLETIEAVKTTRTYYEAGKILEPPCSSDAVRSRMSRIRKKIARAQNVINISHNWKKNSRRLRKLLIEGSEREDGN